MDEGFGMKKSVKKSASLTPDWDKVLSKIDDEKRLLISKIPSHIHEREKAHFCTGSSYLGQWDKIGMSGYGTYTLPHNVQYEGNMHDGMFHGEGVLTFPMGQKIEGIWERGKIISWKYRFPDGLEYSEPWHYCKMPDRRFATSIMEGLRPAGRELVTNDHLARYIPGLCYDVGDGFYNPKTKCVTSTTPSRMTLRIPTKVEELWIIKNCRRGKKEPVGYMPSLYEHWVSGKKDDPEMLELLREYGEKEKEEMIKVEQEEAEGVKYVVQEEHESSSSEEEAVDVKKKKRVQVRI